MIKLLMGGERRNRDCCKAMVVQLIAPGPDKCPRLAAVRCFVPRVRLSCPREELGELGMCGELGYVVSELALYSQLTHECKVCPSSFYRHIFPMTGNGCFRVRQVTKN